jgi:Uma2 family endonuclease
MPYVKKAELIEGVVHMPSPVRLQSHAQPHGQVITWLGVYCAATPGIFLADNATVRLDLDNEPQPDALLRLAPDQGGQARVSDGDYLEGPPELIAEIAASSAAYDLHEKLRVYRRSGVQEYLVWRVGDRQVDWFSLSEGEYVPLRPDADGVLRSQAFPGLHLDVAALLEGDLARVLAVLQEGLETAEHAAFVEHLAAR